MPRQLRKCKFDNILGNVTTFFNIKTNLSLTEDEFYSQELGNEIYDKIGDVFGHFFPEVNKNTQYNLTGVWDASITDRHGYVIHI